MCCLTSLAGVTRVTPALLARVHSNWLAHVDKPLGVRPMSRMIADMRSPLLARTAWDVSKPGPPDNPPKEEELRGYSMTSWTASPERTAESRSAYASGEKYISYLLRAS